ncbi:hypothetical protein [Labrys sp. 22185]|uniref:hypothetical protein n=1 Tax=Labrys sp. 22185 TaxID=3453888 RepID=UPI003F87B310
MIGMLLTSNPGFSTGGSSCRRTDPAGFGLEIEADDEKAHGISAEQATSSDLPIRETASGPVTGTPSS